MQKQIITYLSQTTLKAAICEIYIGLIEGNNDEKTKQKIKRELVQLLHQYLIKNNVDSTLLPVCMHTFTLSDIKAQKNIYNLNKLMMCYQALRKTP